MARRSWRSDLFRVWIAYFASGIAMIPGAILYVMLMDRSVGERASFTIALSIAVVMGTTTWFLVERGLRVSKPHREQIVFGASDSYVAFENISAPRLAMSFAIVICCVSGLPIERAVATANLTGIPAGRTTILPQMFTDKR
jgi:hypothetical protein